MKGCPSILQQSVKSACPGMQGLRITDDWWYLRAHHWQNSNVAFGGNQGCTTDASYRPRSTNLWFSITWQLDITLTSAWYCFPTWCFLQQSYMKNPDMKVYEYDGKKYVHQLIIKLSGFCLSWRIWTWYKYIWYQMYPNMTTKELEIRDFQDQQPQHLHKNSLPLVLRMPSHASSWGSFSHRANGGVTPCKSSQ